MKKTIMLATLVVCMVMFGAGTTYAQMMGPGMMGPGYGPPSQDNWSYCPYCGSYLGPGYGYNMGPGMMGRGYGMGPGMMGGGYGMGPGYGGYGYNMGPGMMGRGYGMGPGYGRQYGPQYQQPSAPLDKAAAEQEVENYLKSTRNPNLKIGAVEEKGDHYEVGIETKDGALVDKILVDKDTGFMRSAY
jgi:hypothetical protein